MGIIIGGFNKLISGIGSGLTAILNLLPSSPFTWNVSLIDNQFLKVLYWIVPVQQITFLLETWIISVGLYYAVRTILRWMKVAGD